MTAKKVPMYTRIRASKAFMADYPPWRFYPPHATILILGIAAIECLSFGGQSCSLVYWPSGQDRKNSRVSATMPRHERSIAWPFGRRGKQQTGGNRRARGGPAAQPYAD